MKKVLKRIQRPTPTFFRTIRNAGVTLAAISTAIISEPVAVPAILVKVASYLAIGGAVAGAVSQTAVKHERK